MDENGARNLPHNVSNYAVLTTTVSDVGLSCPFTPSTEHVALSSFDRVKDDEVEIPEVKSTCHPDTGTTVPSMTHFEVDLPRGGGGACG